MPEVGVGEEMRCEECEGYGNVYVPGVSQKRCGSLHRRSD